jgi:ABC-type transporter Mla MlaB component
MEIVDQLARLQLQARRLGCSIRVRRACAELRELIELSGLEDVLVSED